MFKRISLAVVLFGLGAICGMGQIRSITQTTTAATNLTVSIETNTQYVLYSIAVAFTNLGTSTGTVTLAHNRAGYSISPLQSMTLVGSNSAVVYFDAPYMVDGKQGDTLTISTTNAGQAAKIFLTIEYE